MVVEAAQGMDVLLHGQELWAQASQQMAVQGGHGVRVGATKWGYDVGVGTVGGRLNTDAVGLDGGAVASSDVWRGAVVEAGSDIVLDGAARASLQGHDIRLEAQGRAVEMQASSITMQTQWSQDVAATLNGGVLRIRLCQT